MIDESYKFFSYKLQVKEHHLDTFGHMNNAVYFSILEEARWEMISERGFGVHDIQKLQMGPVIIEASIRFKIELHLRENIEIRTQAKDFLNPKVILVYQEILNSSRKKATLAEFKIAQMDLKERKLVNPDSRFLSSIGYKEKIT